MRTEVSEIGLRTGTTFRLDVQPILSRQAPPPLAAASAKNTQLRQKALLVGVVARSERYPRIQLQKVLRNYIMTARSPNLVAYRALYPQQSSKDVRRTAGPSAAAKALLKKTLQSRRVRAPKAVVLHTRVRRLAVRSPRPNLLLFSECFLQAQMPESHFER